MGELKDKFNKMKGKRNQAGSPPYYVNEILEDIVDKVESGSKGSSMININHADLVNLRDNSGLIPGQQYRIIDYVTETTDPETCSANHPFDIIVTADDVNILNENARAIQHDGDEYFSKNNLATWELKYCLDNDNHKFSWAKMAGTFANIYDNKYNIVYYDCLLISTNDTRFDGFPFVFEVNDDGFIAHIHSKHKEFDTTTECILTFDETIVEILIGYITITKINEPGKGVIYELKDEYNNICNYDFKNIMFKRYYVVIPEFKYDENHKINQSEGYFYSINGIESDLGILQNSIVDYDNYKYFYTFSVVNRNSENIEDLSSFVNKNDIIRNNNKIISEILYYLPNIVCNCTFKHLNKIEIFNSHDYTLLSDNGLLDSIKIINSYSGIINTGSDINLYNTSYSFIEQSNCINIFNGSSFYISHALNVHISNDAWYALDLLIYWSSYLELGLVHNTELISINNAYISNGCRNIHINCTNSSGSDIHIQENCQDINIVGRCDGLKIGKGCNNIVGNSFRNVNITSSGSVEFTSGIENVEIIDVHSMRFLNYIKNAKILPTSNFTQKQDVSISDTDHLSFKYIKIDYNFDTNQIETEIYKPFV